MKNGQPCSESAIVVPPHRFHICIEAHDIDFMGHVNNATYLRWVQEAVLDHWQTHASPSALAKYLWLAVQHDITFTQPAYSLDRLDAMVTLRHVRRQSAYFDTVILRGDNIVAQANSRWCCIDKKTRKPTRIPVEIVQHVVLSLGELRGAVPRKEVVDPVDRITGDVGQHLARSTLGVDTVELGSADPRVDSRGALASVVDAGKQGVESANDNIAHGPLQPNCVIS